MDLNPNTSKPLWRRIQDDIAGQIRLGQVEPGEQLPTEHAYAEHYGVNRHTVRQAIAGLVDMGMVRVEQGRGTFAREPVLEYPLSKEARFSDIVRAASGDPKGSLLDHGEEAARGEVADALRLRPGAPVIRLEMKGEINGHVVMVSTGYFPKSICDGIVEHFRETGSVTRSLAALGIEDFSRETTNVSARLPCPSDARILGQPRNRPVLLTEAINVDPTGRPVEFGRTRFASDWVTLKVST